MESKYKLMTNQKYKFDPESFNRNKQTQFVVNNIPKNSRVCEFGCSSGLLSAVLSEQGCYVTGLDIDKASLKIAEKHQIKTIYADLNNIDCWSKALETEKFDVLIFLHILEHLVNPLDVLLEASRFLKEDNCIFIGLPNICNAKDRFNITFGRFDYTEIGVMDNTHLRFYNVKTARDLISHAGLEIVEYYSPWQVNPIGHFLDHIPIIWRLKNLFKDKPKNNLGFSPNITDVVMIFKCKKNEKSNC